MSGDTVSVSCSLQCDGIIVIVISKHPEQDRRTPKKVEMWESEEAEGRNLSGR